MYFRNMGISIDVKKDDGEVAFFLGAYKLVIYDENKVNDRTIQWVKLVRIISVNIILIVLDGNESHIYKMKLFDEGVDDYFYKPIHLVELFMKVQIFLKERISVPRNLEIKAGDLRIDDVSKQVSYLGNDILLSPREYYILLLLAQQSPNPVSTILISKVVWGMEFGKNEKLLMVYINYLRKKLDKRFGRKIIFNKHGFGYFIK